MRGIDRRFDALVIGSGVAGSIAVKELTERGLDVLLLEVVAISPTPTASLHRPGPPSTRH